MTPKLVTFIRLLRAEGVRLSVAESVDALQSVERVGVDNRELLRLTLRTTLVKSAQDFPTFDALFDRFFTMPRRRKRRRKRNQNAANEGFGRRTQPQAQGTRPQPPPQPTPPAATAQQPAEQQEHEQAQEELAALEQAWQEHMQSHSRQVTEPRHIHDDDLTRTRLDRPFPPAQLADMYREVDRLVARLLTRRALRYRRARRGRVDLRRTVLQGLRSGNEAPFTLVHRRRNLTKLRLIVLCDVSGSVWQVSTFLLKLVHTLQAEFTSVRSLLFVNGLVDVTPLFRHMRFPDDLEALRHYPNLNLFGYSDFGRVFYQFYRDLLGDLTRDTVLLILGDARNNAFDPQAWTLEEISQHCRRVLWLNPEARHEWNQDDSIVNIYAPYCNAVLECWTLEHLVQAAEVLLQP